MVKFCTKYGILQPTEPFLFKIAIAEAFSIQMWLLDGLEFETPDLKLIPKKYCCQNSQHMIQTICFVEQLTNGDVA
jgi:hypothetical protein